MQRLLEDFDNLFDLTYLIGDLSQRSQVSLFVTELNRVLHDCIRPEHSSLYATVFLMTLDRGGHAVYCSSGHPPILVRRAEGGIEEPAPLDRPVGLFADTTGGPREPTRTIYDEISSRRDIDKLEDDVTFLAVEL